MIVGEGEFSSTTGTQRRAFLWKLAADGPVRPEDNQYVQIVAGQFSMIVPARRGQPLVIEASPDLSQWMPISTNYNRTGVLDFTDPSLRAAARRFYRMRVAGQ